LRDLADADALRARVARQYPDLAVSTASEFADQQAMFDILNGVAMTVAGLAVVIGGVVMTNTLFMSILERTREIGLLRAVGWRKRRVLALILGESLILSLLGGLLGVVMGVAAVFALGRSASWLGALGTHFTPGLLIRALVTVTLLGLVGGAYPAWRASCLLPLEALRYEGGSGARAARALHVPGGMVIRTLWRRRMRTALALVGIGISIAAILALGALVEGGIDLFTQVWRGSQTDLVAIEADVDSDLSAIDERVGARIEARADVEAVSGMILTAINTEQMPMLLVFGYHPRSFAIRHFQVIEGAPLAGRHQVLVGYKAAEQMGLQVGDALRLLKSNFRIVGIYETGLAYEEIGVVIGLREAQSLTGKPRQVMYYAIKLHDPAQVEAVRDDLAIKYPYIDFSLTSEVMEGMSDFRVVEEMLGQISLLAVFIGALGMLNAMLMSVLERTREIGVLRALGWRRRRVLGMILEESLVLGVIGGIFGVFLALGMTSLIPLVPGLYGEIEPVYTPQLIAQSIAVALAAGVAGGLYPAWRATRMRPVEALRYE
jgi:ABC-type antimicrobial peptide transport system permease subunit